jgi:DNA invertase Pin-like site-specific DNA recombinase
METMKNPANKHAVIYLRVSTARQASTGGETEGYSIPAQREACRRKAEELGAEVVQEYVDAGASARSMDRPALQQLLERLHNERDIDYVIVHKVDRLARDRADDVKIGLTIHKAGAVLVSASEQIDESPAGTLLHGIMAAIAEFYSKNLSHEAKKGLHEKVKRGGTPGYCPMGYINAVERIDGKEVKTIILDPERAPHIQWAFEAYATGEWSISDITAELKRRGMVTRPTATRRAVPLARSQVHRFLSSSYYTGRLPFKGADYEGKHPAIVSENVWQQVQDVLGGRRYAGDRSWRHEHYLKGTVFCANCGSRMSFGYSRGKKGGRYPYFFCLGRNKHRTDCKLPYLAGDKVEKYVMDFWQEQSLAPELIDGIRQSVTGDLEEQRKQDKKLLATQKRRLHKLESQRQKLIDAYLAEAIPVTDLKQRQEALAAEQRDAERLIELAGVNHDLVEERLETALELLEHCDRLYVGAPDNVRRSFNQAFFEALYIDENGVQRAEMRPPFAQLKDKVIGLLDEDDVDDDIDSSNGRSGNLPKTKKNPSSGGTRGSNETLLAERRGFEPARPCGLPVFNQASSRAREAGRQKSQ